jgi:integrase
VQTTRRSPWDRAAPARPPTTPARSRWRASGIARCFAGAFRRSEVCALEVSDLTHTKDRLRIRIKRSKTDAAGEGQEIAVMRGVRIQLVAAVEAWPEVSGITEGRSAGARRPQH